MKLWIKHLYITLKYKIPIDNLIIDSRGFLWEISENFIKSRGPIKFDNLKLTSDLYIQKWIDRQ